MTEQEQIEYMGLAATVARLMVSVKQLETTLAERDAEIARLREEAQP